MNASHKFVILIALFILGGACPDGSAGPEPTGGGIGGTGYPATNPLSATADTTDVMCPPGGQIGELRRRTTNNQSIERSEKLCVGTVVATGANERAILDLQTGERIHLNEESRLIVSTKTSEVNLNLIEIALQSGSLMIRGVREEKDRKIRVTGIFGMLTIRSGDMNIQIFPGQATDRILQKRAIVHIPEGSAILSTGQDEQILSEGITATVFGDDNYMLIKTTRVRKAHKLFTEK